MTLSNRSDENSDLRVTSFSPVDSKPISGGLALIVILGAVLFATGGVLALVHPAIMVSPHDEINAAVRIYAGYFASRNLALAFMLLALLALRARRALGNLLTLVALIQVFDAGMDCVEGRWAIVPGVLVLALLFLIAANRLCGSPFWTIGAWRR